jgi:hypothetical protein
MRFTHRIYDKVPEAINCRALAQEIQPYILESKDVITIIRREGDVTSFLSVI